MKRLHSARVLVAGSVCFAWALGSARAATITETTPFTILAPATANLPAQTINVSTPQFNPALGTFEGGATTITGTVSTALEFFSTGAGGPHDVFLSDTLSVSGIPGLFGGELTGIVPADQPVFTSAVTIPFGPVGRGDPADLAVGTGTWNQVFSLPSPSLIVMQSPATVIVPGLMVSGSSVTTYTYLAATTPVPEPRSFGVLASIFGFGFSVRYWRRGGSKRMPAGSQWQVSL